MIPKMFAALIFLNYEIWDYNILISCFYSPEPKTFTNIFLNTTCDSRVASPHFGYPLLLIKLQLPSVLRKSISSPQLPAIQLSRSPTHSLHLSFPRTPLSTATKMQGLPGLQSIQLLVHVLSLSLHASEGGMSKRPLKHTMHKPIAQTEKEDTQDNLSRHMTLKENPFMANAACQLGMEKIFKVQQASKIFQNIYSSPWLVRQGSLTHQEGGPTALSLYNQGTQIKNKPESRQIFTNLRDELFLYLIQKHSK